ncbi:MAG: lytic transglycosylase domain-containing protein [Terriglobales bacterium]
MKATRGTNAARCCGAIIYAAVILGLSLPTFAADLAVLNNGFTIHHEHRRVIGDVTRLYFSVDDSSFTDVPTAEITGYEMDLTLPVPPPASALTNSKSTSLNSAQSAAHLTEVVNSASAAYHLDPDLVNSVIHAESGFNSHAISPKGARGLMQLMPSTANNLGVKDVFDPEANVGGGSRYLRELLERYNFDLVKALAAYNAGPQRVEQYNGVPPFRETRAYVARIVHDYNRKKIAQEKQQKAEARTKKLQAAQSTKQSNVKVSGSRTHSQKSRLSPSAAAHTSKYPAKTTSQLAANPASTASAR